MCIVYFHIFENNKTRRKQMDNPKIDKLVDVKQKENGVELTFSKDIPNEVINEQVSSCQAATCTCCTPAFRENVVGFSSETTEAGVKVTIKGNVIAEQVKENVLSCAPKLKKG